MWRLIRLGGRRRLTLSGLIKTLLTLIIVYYLGGEFAGKWTRGNRGQADRNLAGTARIVDGDTLDLDGEKLRLQGIDAPEMAQSCEADNRPVKCGKLAAEHLEDLIGSQALNCAVEGRDRYGRGLARCEAGSRDIAEAMTKDGWAIADRRYSKGRYDAAEAAARAGRRGIWAMHFEDPSEWRARHNNTHRTTESRLNVTDQP
jgi:endonuclease YncB( thermonuclease family)